MKIHFSIDDVIDSFLWLTSHDCESIFESYVFDFARTLYYTYGIYTTCNCMYTNGINNLSDVSDKYKREFEQNSEWLKFSFHCLGPNSNYGDADEEAFAKDYDMVIKELRRIMGEKAISDIVRLHFFAGNSQVVRYLKNQGVRILLTADDRRGSYDLSAEEEQTVWSKGVLCKQGMTYIKTDFRAELEEEELKYNKQIFVVFTHEHYIGKQAIRDKICKAIEKKGVIENLL